MTMFVCSISFNHNTLEVFLSFIICEQKLQNREVDVIPMTIVLILKSHSKCPAVPIMLRCLQQFVDEVH